MTPKEIKELLAYLRSIDISLGRIAEALEKSDDEEDKSKSSCDMYHIGQIVRVGLDRYEIIDISPEPYLEFNDGSKHYVMTIKLCGGDYNDIVCVNDAQIKMEENNE